MVLSLKIWRHYLYEIRGTIYMDHKSLRYFLDQPNLNMRKRGWLHVVNDYKYDILYHTGKANVLSDALSSNTAGTPTRDICLRMNIT